MRTPIGGFQNEYVTGSPNEFDGTFNGGGYAVTNLNIGSSLAPDNTLNSPGLFGYLGTSGKVKNLNVSVSIHSSYGDDSTWASIGAIAAYSIGRIEACSSSGVITGCHSSCSVSAVAGGLAGDAHVGGIAGYNERSEVSSCYATGSITAGSGVNDVFAGGLLGTNYLGTVTDSYATGNVLTLDIGIAGGLTGYNDGTVQNCHATGSVTTGDGGHPERLK